MNVRISPCWSSSENQLAVARKERERAEWGTKQGYIKTYHARLRRPLLGLEKDRFGLFAGRALLIRAW